MQNSGIGSTQQGQGEARPNHNFIGNRRLHSATSTYPNHIHISSTRVMICSTSSAAHGILLVETLQRLTHICPQPSPAATAPVNLSWKTRLFKLRTFSSSVFWCLSQSPSLFPSFFFYGFPYRLFDFLFISIISFQIFPCPFLPDLPAFSLARLRFGSETRSSGAAASGVHHVQELGREAELGQPEVTEVTEVVELDTVDTVDTVEDFQDFERSKNSRSFRSLRSGASLTWGSVIRLRISWPINLLRILWILWLRLLLGLFPFELRNWAIADCQRHLGAQPRPQQHSLGNAWDNLNRTVKCLVSSNKLSKCVEDLQFLAWVPLQSAASALPTPLILVWLALRLKKHMSQRPMAS